MALTEGVSVATTFESRGVPAPHLPPHPGGLGVDDESTPGTPNKVHPTSNVQDTTVQ